eukprot:12224507-Karenia_brevis.AAC.1
MQRPLPYAAASFGRQLHTVPPCPVLCYAAASLGATTHAVLPSLYCVVFAVDVAFVIPVTVAIAAAVAIA